MVEDPGNSKFQITFRTFQKFLRATPRSDGRLLTTHLGKTILFISFKPCLYLLRYPVRIFIICYD